MSNPSTKTSGRFRHHPKSLDEEPIRAELYSIERLEQFAAALAAEHKATTTVRDRRRLLLPRLEENRRQLLAAYTTLANTIREERAISPAAEWLVDNFHLVEEQLREIREDLPPGYYRELPKLKDGKLAGYPRIYSIALALVAHTDSRLETETLKRFMRAYQQITPLSIGEAWALAITLRLALVENLRRLATRIIVARDEREEADALADKLIDLAGRQPEQLLPTLAYVRKPGQQFDRAFVVQLTQRLRDQDAALMPAFDWLEKQLARQGTIAEEIVHLEHQRQAEAQVSVGNIITSMRLLSTIDWRDFFEAVSLVDPVLREDPAGAYALMDFATRDRYRHIIERISRRSKISEPDVARRAVEMAAQIALADAPDERQSHVGFFLIDDGRARLERELSYRQGLRERVSRFVLRRPTVSYLGAITMLTLLILTALFAHAFHNHASTLSLVLVVALALVPASELALTALNIDVTLFFKPRTLPKMDYSKGVPEEARTMIVVPTIFSSEAAVRELLEKLEVHYLANTDEHFHFALLGDWSDAAQEEMPDDAVTLDAAVSGIEELNARYAKDDADYFYLFHRRRQWNASEEKWIGWERKRGKLEEFNRLLRGARDTSYIVSVGDQSVLPRIRYVITLDSDTQLPRDAARRLVGTIAHPLNRAQLDPQTHIVARGYGILQPRVSVSHQSSLRSRFAHIYSGNTGIDPYTSAVSDVYQDLFAEGSFTGKGLYDVEAFEAALHERVPENSLLSHDLFEGSFARAALVTDIEVFDDYPAHYDTHASRQHRWTRGDWQIARWLLPRVRDAHGRVVTNALSVISRWKILDNLRRSLVAPTLVLWLIGAWTIFPGSTFWWTLFAALVLVFPVYAHLPASITRHPRGLKLSAHLRNVWSDALINTAQLALTVSFLAHQAYLMTDAIARISYRKFVSRKHLLEWMTAAQAEQGSAHDAASFFRLMWPAPLISLATFALVFFVRPRALFFAAPFLLAWAVSPIIAYQLSRKLTPQRIPLTGDDERTLRLLARRTWRFFETFVGTQDNWLAPDNYQETPHPVIAHRTSPTNTGLLLLSTIAARDFGYVGTHELIERCELTFASLDKLEKFRGHFLNWYDTTTLEPLSPRYVSTVDSGNLAGHLIALKQSCIEIVDEPLFDARIRRGICDTLDLMHEEATRIGTAAAQGRTEAVTFKQLRAEIETCRTLAQAAAEKTAWSDWAIFFEELARRGAIIEDALNAITLAYGTDNFEELRYWNTSFIQQVRQGTRDLAVLAPWAASLIPHLTPVINACSAEAAVHWLKIVKVLERVSSTAELPSLCDAALVELAALHAELQQRVPPQNIEQDAALKGISLITTAIEEAAQHCRDLLARYARLAERSEAFVQAMDFRFLYDEERKVFSIGYNFADNRCDNSFYDLLASESCLASFIAVAKSDVPLEHWFHLGRQLTQVDNSRALVSWTATMFEYLMPLLIMRSFDDTLLGQTHHAAVARQIEYGKERGVAWGISESAYNARDLQMNYQYGPFGVPGLGLKRGLSEDLVISPYSTLLAAMVDPHAAVQNISRLTREGALARYGFYEAIDYTAERLPKNQRRAIIQAFMVHHQGMSLVALDNVLNHNIMQRRFHAEPLVQATELLLQERIPREAATTTPRSAEALMKRSVNTLAAPVTRRFDAADLPTPRTQLLSNGTYSVMMTTAGAGYSMYGKLAVTRWREDATCDNWGSFCYLRDVRSGAVWSTGYQPTQRTPQAYEVFFAEDKVEFLRRDAGLETHTEIIVSPEDNAELRRVSITNRSPRAREIEVTSYAEVVLATPAADAAHPAFSNLFIETEFFASENALLAHRRQRSPTDEPIWGVHVVATDDESVGAVQYETDRARFLGRGHSAADAAAITEDRPLSNTTGAVLDPVFSLRQRVRIRPNETVRISFATAVAHTRDEALRLADKYHDASTFEREATLAWTKSQVEMRHLNINAEEAHLFQRLAGRVLYSDSSLRPRSGVLALNTRTQSALWAYGISGDLPIVLVRISDQSDLPLVRQIIRGHEYLRLKGLSIDLLILNDHPPSYAQSLQDELQMLVRTSGSQALLDKPGGVYLRRTDILPEADKILFHAVARVAVVTERGSLEDQLVRRPVEEELPPPLAARLPSRTYPEPAVAVPERSFFNGLGGFVDKGREYVTVLGEGQWTPAPWLNVVSNRKDFGFQVTESGAGYTWSVNSRENRLTPWSNDAVSDPIGECLYLRDEDTGTVWSPTPLPIREAEPYSIRHGQGYTVFEHTSHGISQELVMFVPLDATVKISLLRLRNRTDRKRRISVTSYAELVLGVQRGASAPYVISQIDGATGSIFARNPYNNEFAQRIFFADISERTRTLTCDRKEFLGRNGSHARPAALRRVSLSGRVGAGIDPCAAMQTIIELEPGEAREIHTLLGQGESIEEARQLVTTYRQPARVNAAFEEIVGYWDKLLGAVEVRTPDAAMDVMLNRWLLYQALACRVWSRSAFYQSGGAYGFRDQLQDVMALVYSEPQIAREQILRAAAHQFKEGDVQHWWHPPTSRGVRTRFSDDLLWLPFVASFYAQVTGDESVFDEIIPFIEAPQLTEGEDESYLQPSVSAESATIYEHCVRTIDRSLGVGAHGLPLIGSGDWNDGMNRIGNKGQGESVWMGWFLHKTLADFAVFCERRRQTERAELYRAHMKKLQQALEAEAWDGDWYVRAYFDDGTPLGSSKNEECRIDSIAQSWGVISGAADPHRAQRAMASVEEYLVRRGDGLVILFTPPFDKSALDPGYIKGYVPGVRENGGQYTHAALWTLIAYARLGDGDRAGELFALLNPINHASTRAGMHKYKVEPYVAAGDVYAVWPHTGRGGWSWYTGSASWMYRAGLESILGFQLRGALLRIDPCIPRGWPGFEINYRYGKSQYHIQIENPYGMSRGVAEIEVDGKQQTSIEIALVDDGEQHHVRIRLGDEELSRHTEHIDEESLSEEKQQSRV